jgi:hypothetical protein
VEIGGNFHWFLQPLRLRLVISISITDRTSRFPLSTKNFEKIYAAKMGEVGNQVLAPGRSGKSRSVPGMRQKLEAWNLTVDGLDEDRFRNLNAKTAKTAKEIFTGGNGAIWRGPSRELPAVKVSGFWQGSNVKELGVAWQSSVGKSKLFAMSR